MIPIDKQAHFYSGAALCFAVGILTAPFYGFLAAAAVGVAKEVWDKAGHGTPDVLDMLATIGGGIAAFVVFAVSSFIN